MLKMYVKLQNLLQSEEGQGMTEYAMIVGLIVVAIMAVVGLFTGQIQTLITNITAKLTTVSTQLAP